MSWNSRYYHTKLGKNVIVNRTASAWKPSLKNANCNAVAFPRKAHFGLKSLQHKTRLYVLPTPSNFQIGFFRSCHISKPAFELLAELHLSAGMDETKCRLHTCIWTINQIKARDFPYADVLLTANWIRMSVLEGRHF